MPSGSRRNTTLDGLRGIAAISVCAYHLTAKLNVPGMFLVRGQIAVDFFFVLSGFVLAYASEQRLASRQITPFQFIAQRLARFFPMTALAVMIGVIGVMVLSQKQIVDHPVDRPLLGALLSLFWLPTTAGSRLAFFPNNALWSLSGELVINVIFAFAAGLRLRWLVAAQVVLVLAFAVFGFSGRYVGFGFQELGLVPLTLLRVAVSFWAGVLVFRLRHQLGSLPAVNPIWLALVLMGSMLMPGGAAVWRTFYSLMYIVIIFPALIWFAADAKPVFQKLGAALGDLSFPLYAIHLPIVSALASVLLPQPLWVRLVAGLVIISLLSVFALIVDRYIDIPARHALTKIVRRRRVVAPAPMPGPASGLASQ